MDPKSWRHKRHTTPQPYRITAECPFEYFGEHTLCHNESVLVTWILSHPGLCRATDFYNKTFPVPTLYVVGALLYQVEGRSWIYVQHVNLRATRPHRPHTAVSSVNCVGISRKLKITCQDQKSFSTSFLSIIYDNLYQYQPMMSPVAVDIDKCDFFLPLVKGVTRFIAANQLLKMKCPKLPIKD